MTESSTTHLAQTTARGVTFNAASSLVVVAVDMAVGLLLLPFMMRELGLPAYGVWETTGGLFAYSLLLQLGLNSAVNYHVPRLLVQNDHEGISRVVSTVAVVYLLAALVVLGATALISAYFPVLFNVEPEYAATGQILAAMVGGYFVFALPLMLFQGVLSGLQRYVQMNLIRLVMHLTRAVLIVVLLKTGVGLIGIGIAHAGTRLIEAALMPILVKRALPQLRIRLRYASFATFRRIIGYGVNTLIWSASDTMFNRSGAVVLGVLLTMSDVSLFAAPMMIVMAFSALAQSMSAAVKPAASVLYAQDDMKRVRELSLRGSRYVSMALFPIAVLICAFGGPFMVAWMNMNEEFAQMGPILALLVAMQFFNVGQRASALVLMGMGKHRPFAVSTFVTAIGGVITMVVLIEVFGAGLWGVAIGHAAATGVIGLIFLPIYVSKVLEIPVGRHVATIFGRPLLSSLPFVFVVALVRYFYRPTQLWSIGLVCIGCTGLAFVCYWLWGISEHERERVQSVIGHIGISRKQYPTKRTNGGSED